MSVENVVCTCHFRFVAQVRRRHEQTSQQQRWNSHPWGELGSGFQSVRSKIGPYKAAQDAAAAAAAADNAAFDGLDDLDDTVSTSTGTISTVSS